MSYNHRVLKKMSVSGKGSGSSSGKETGDINSEILEMMNDPRYLRQSSALINEALQKGFDVLQLADGDIITTGTKTVVYQYTWDKDKGKLVKTKVDSGTVKKARRTGLVDGDVEEMDENEREDA